MLQKKLEGYVDTIHPEGIRGWAIDRSALQHPVYVDVFFNGVLFARILACFYRADLAEAGLAGGNCAFELSFPSRLSDGTERTVAVRFADTDILLPNSPQQVLFSVAEPKRSCGNPTAPFLQHVKAAWAAGLNEEARFWWQWLSTSEDSVAADRARRAQPREPDPEIQTLLNAPEGAIVRFLDVGSGPLTVLPSVWPGRKIELKAADALANQYNRMLQEVGITPLVAPDFVEAERLSGAYPKHYFDFIECVNTLDRCSDPLTALAEMLTVLRPGGIIRIISEMNVGQKTGYAGRQQWNISIERGRPVIWSTQSYTDLLDYLGKQATLEHAGIQGNMIRVVFRSAA